MKFYYYLSDKNDVYYNQAVEKLLFERCASDGLTVYLWANDNTVVIGKNQCAYTELNTGLFESEGGHLARRISGGGAVYHDVNNLNFTFIAPDGLYDKSCRFDIILEAVKSFSLDARLSGRNDIEIDGRKFSGNAFYRSGGCSLHHGTVLINTDLSKLERYLTVDRQKLESKGVASVASRVVNLFELNKNVTRESLKSRIIDVIKRRGECTEIVLEPFSNDITRLRAEFALRDWTVGKSPQCSISKRARFSWGSAEVRYGIYGGVIFDAAVYTDSLEYEFFERLPKLLNGQPIGSPVACGGLTELEHVIMSDIISLIIS